jgi:hypothetical protein
MCQITIEDVYARKCDKCNKGFNAGFLDDLAYYCSERCLIKSNQEKILKYSWLNWEQDHKNNPDDCYYTEWYDDLDEYFEDDFGSQDIFKENGQLINELEFNEIKKGLKKC